MPHYIALQRVLTGFGDITVTGPAALAAMIWFARVIGRGAALEFAVAPAATFAVIALLKLVMRTSGGVFANTLFAFSAGAPSGHMGMSTVVYGGLSLLLLRHERTGLTLAAAALSVVLLIAIAVTRVTLHAHLPADVAAGFLLGGCGATWMARFVRLPAGISEGKIVLLMASVVIIVILMRISGLHVDSAKLI